MSLFCVPVVAEATPRLLIYFPVVDAAAAASTPRLLGINPAFFDSRLEALRHRRILIIGMKFGDSLRLMNQEAWYGLATTGKQTRGTTGKQ